MYGSVKRKGSVSTDNKPAILPSENHGNLSIELPKLLRIEGFQEERGGYESVSIDDDDGQSEDVVYVESKSDGNAISKKRKASKKLKSPRFVCSQFLIVRARLVKLYGFNHLWGHFIFRVFWIL